MDSTLRFHGANSKHTASAMCPLRDLDDAGNLGPERCSHPGIVKSPGGNAATLAEGAMVVKFVIVCSWNRKNRCLDDGQLTAMAVTGELLSRAHLRDQSELSIGGGKELRFALLPVRRQVCHRIGARFHAPAASHFWG